jgi:hypothetical protein
MVRAVKPPILDALDLEREIEKEFRKLDQHDSLPTEFAPPSVRAPDLGMPDYVEHSDGATEIGKLSAEAVVREYEAAAKDIEALGTELTERARQCEAMMRDALLVTDELKETAARYRAEAKRVFDQIESCSLLTAEVRKICEDMKERLAGSGKLENKADA